MSDEPKFTMPDDEPVYMPGRPLSDLIRGESEPGSENMDSDVEDMVNHDDGVSRAATGSVPAIDPARTGKHLATQTEYPWRTAVLHAGSTTIASLVAVASVIGDERVQDLINRYVPGQAAGVIAFGVGCGLVAGTLSRIANLPAVAALRTKIGLGPIAKKNLTR